MPTSWSRRGADTGTEAGPTGGRAWARLDLESAVPVFLQLYRQVVGAILEGSVPPGRVLPSARQLASDLGIHYHTVNKAYLLLRRDGFLVLNRRKQLLARLPRAPAPSYVGDWSDRQETLLHEALGHGVRPEELLRRLERSLRRAGLSRRRPAGGE